MPLYSVNAPKAPNHVEAFPTSGCTLIPGAWFQPLQSYPEPKFRYLLTTIFLNGAQIGFCGDLTKFVGANLASAYLDTETVQCGIHQDLDARKVRIVDHGEVKISSPIGLVPKHDGGYRWTHHLPFEPKGRTLGASVNARIPLA